MGNGSILWTLLPLSEKLTARTSKRVSLSFLSVTGSYVAQGGLRFPSLDWPRTTDPLPSLPTTPVRLLFVFLFWNETIVKHPHSEIGCGTLRRHL